MRYNVKEYLHCLSGERIFAVLNYDASFCGICIVYMRVYTDENVVLITYIYIIVFWKVLNAAAY